MKKRLLIALLLMSFTSVVAAYFVSLDAPQDFPTNI